jgi:uncharacterized protein (DUF305 family)
MSTEAIHQGERRHHERRSSAGAAHHAATPGTHSMHEASYGRFAAMVTTSTLLGFGAMYVSTYQLDHVYFSWNRLFMTFVMAGVMTAVMMLFMWRMYPNRFANYAVLGVAALLLLCGVALARTQATVGEVDWMKAMIPHHSIAILTSERASISDPRVRELADQIIESQRKEIAEMKVLVQELENR